jgi:hypothetical protein
MKGKIILLLLLAIISNANVFAQSGNYKCCIENIVNPDPTTIEFDVFLEWNGIDSQRLTAVQGGIKFNYDEVANGGTITGSFKPGSADKALPRYQQSPKWNVNPLSKQIRLLAAIAPDSAAIKIPPPPGIKLGTFVMKNTAPFKSISNLNFEWSFASGSSTTTKTQVSTYTEGIFSTKDITVPGNHCVKK